ncbi:unnamed protein product [Nezara viridula]|uniref:Uncharacterized protein n=1 Tax=Nezara viridula TaxID=85310 RepID=A0A9P0MGU3_NEZVI|nr:unnamed protein product [Nezara viridula]
MMGRTDYLSPEDEDELRVAPVITSSSGDDLIRIEAATLPICPEATSRRICNSWRYRGGGGSARTAVSDLKTYIMLLFAMLCHVSTLSL